MVYHDLADVVALAPVDAYLVPVIQREVQPVVEDEPCRVVDGALVPQACPHLPEQQVGQPVHAALRLAPDEQRLALAPVAEYGLNQFVPVERVGDALDDLFLGADVAQLVGRHLLKVFSPVGVAVGLYRTAVQM